MLQEHSNWINFTLHNLSSTELNILKLVFKLKYDSKIFNFKNKFINKNKTNFSIFNKNIAVISNIKNMYFFRSFIFTNLENIINTNTSILKLIGYFNNLYFIQSGIINKYKKNSIIKVYNCILIIIINKSLILKKIFFYLITYIFILLTIYLMFLYIKNIFFYKFNLFLIP
jgi:hypothetical protein